MIFKSSMPTITERSDLGDFLYALYEEQFDFEELQISNIPEGHLRDEWLIQWKSKFYSPFGFDEDKTYNWFMERLEDQFALISNKVLRQCLKFTVVCTINMVVRHEIEHHIADEIAQSTAEICSSLHL